MRFPAATASLDEAGHEGFDDVHRASDEPVVTVPGPLFASPGFAHRQQEDPMQLRFGLQIGRFTWPGAPEETAARLGAIARSAEEVGFSSISVMDHFVQIPSVGREWEDMLESTATLGYLAAATSTARIGTLVTGVTYRNPAHVAKIVATLDVLSGGRAFCGLGAAWFRREHDLYGWEFPPLTRRYELLEDTLQLLPLMWGKGTPPFAGRHLSVAAATCYPRPLQEHIPILVGGSGERRTLRLVARHADACNLFGDPDTVRRKVTVLHEHCATEGRDPATITVTNLTEAAILGGSAGAAERYAPVVGTVAEQIGRYRGVRGGRGPRGRCRRTRRRHAGPTRGVRSGDRRVRRLSAGHRPARLVSQAPPSTRTSPAMASASTCSSRNATPRTSATTGMM